MCRPRWRSLRAHGPFARRRLALAGTVPRRPASRCRRCRRGLRYRGRRGSFRLRRRPQRCCPCRARRRRRRRCRCAPGVRRCRRRPAALAAASVARRPERAPVASRRTRGCNHELPKGLRPARLPGVAPAAAASPLLLAAPAAPAAPALQPTRSLIAGCRSAQRLVGCVLRGALERTFCRFNPVISTKAWVDDVDQRGEGQDPQGVLDNIFHAGLPFVAGTKQLGLETSPESVILVADRRHRPEALKLRQRFAAAGVRVMARGSAPHLGVDRGHQSATRRAIAARRRQASRLAIAKLRRSSAFFRGRGLGASTLRHRCGAPRGVRRQVLRVAAYLVRSLEASRCLGLRGYR